MKKAIIRSVILSFAFTGFIFSTTRAVEDSDVLDKIEPIARGKKKKKQKLSAIFGAIANVCVQAGLVVNAQTEEDQKQGVLNIFGTAFGLAAQINAIDASHTKEKTNLGENEQEIVLGSAAQLVNDWYKILKEEECFAGKMAQFPLLQHLTSLDLEEERMTWIYQALVSSELSQKLLEEVFDYIRQYLHQKIDQILCYLREELVGLVCGPCDDEKEVEGVLEV